MSAGYGPGMPLPNQKITGRDAAWNSRVQCPYCFDCSLMVYGFPGERQATWQFMCPSCYREGRWSDIVLEYRRG